MRPKKRFVRKAEPQKSAAATRRVVGKGRYTSAPPQTVDDPTSVEVQADDLTVVVDATVVEPAVAEPVTKYESRGMVGYGAAPDTAEPEVPAAPPPTLLDEEPLPEWGAWTTVAARDGMRYRRHDSRL